MSLEIENELRISEFSAKWIKNEPFFMGLEPVNDSPYKGKAELVFDEKTLREYGIKPSVDLVGKILVVKLKAREISGKETFRNPDKNKLLISSVQKLEERGWEYDCDGKRSQTKTVYSAHFSTPSIRRGALPCPRYFIQLEIPKVKYESLIELPANSVMGLEIKVK